MVQPAVVFVFLASFASAAKPAVTAVVFAPDGKSVVAASQTGLQILNWPGLKQQRVIKLAAANLNCLAFSPDGKRLAVGGGNPAEEGITQVLAWPAGKVVATLKEHTDSVRAVCWQGNSHLLTAGVDRMIKRWRIGNAKSVRTIKGHSRGVATLCLLKDRNTLLSAGDDQTVRVWDLKNARNLRNLSQHTKPIHDSALKPAKKGLPMVATAAADRTIRFWQPTIGRMVRYVKLKAQPLAIAWLDDTRVAAVCTDGRLRIIDSLEVEVTSNLAATNGWTYAIATHPADGSVVVGGSSGAVRRLKIPKPASSR